MAMTHLELKTAIAAYMHTAELTTEIPDFIEAAEQRIGRDVRIRENNLQATETPVSGEVTFPTRMAEIRRISTGAGASLRVLQPVPASAAWRYGSTGSSIAYSVSDKIYLYPSADTDVDIDYYEYPEPLVGAADGATRPILSRFEGLYTNGALAEASMYLRDYEAAAAFEERFYAEVSRANKAAAEVYTPASTSAYDYRATPPRAL